jgi:hypothetical protein
MYSLIRQQKSRRNQFLKMLVSIFDFPKATVVEMSLEYLYFIAENLIFLDYKYQEEIFHVTYYINLILSVSGETLRASLDGYGKDETPNQGKFMISN